MKLFKKITLILSLLLSSNGYSQLITFDDQGHFNGQNLANPYTITNGGETFRFTVVNGSNPLQYHTTDAFCANGLTGHLRLGTVAASSVTIETVSGNEFNVGDIRFDNIFDCFAFSYSLTLEGFKDAGSTGTQAFSVTGSNNVLTTNTNFDDVDQIVITASDVGNLGIDDINWALVGLPVELASFLGDIDESNNVRLDWSTASESNNDGFSVMHSLDGKNWEELGFVNGVGNSTSMNHYSFNHSVRGAQTHYYQLIQNDFNGVQEASNVITVRSLVEAEERVLVYPNPSSGSDAFLQTTGGIESVTVIDQFGRVIESEFNSKNSHLSLTKRLSGIFFVQVKFISGDVNTTSWKVNQ